VRKKRKEKEDIYSRQIGYRWLGSDHFFFFSPTYQWVCIYISTTIYQIKPATSSFTSYYICLLLVNTIMSDEHHNNMSPAMVSENHK
jgi:hypothetical protein